MKKKRKKSILMGSCKYWEIVTFMAHFSFCGILYIYIFMNLEPKVIQLDI